MIPENDIYFKSDISNDIQDAYIGLIEQWTKNNLFDKSIKKLYIRNFYVFSGTIMFETFFNNNYKISDRPCDIFISFPLKIKNEE